MNGKSELHPSPEELLCFVEGTLGPWTAATVRSHLAVCAPCRDLERDLASYPELEPIDEALAVDAQESRRALGSLRRRLLLVGPDRDDGPAAGAPRERRQPSARRRRLARPRAWLAAAAAAFVLVLLGWWAREPQLARLRALTQTLAARLEASAGALRQPLANVPVTVLLATEDPWRAPEAPGIAAGSGVVVIIQTDEPLPPGELAAEIRTVAGEPVVRIDGLVQTAAGITFFLPPNVLAAGDYRVWLVRGSAETLPMSYDLTIRDRAQRTGE